MKIRFKDGVNLNGVNWSVMKDVLSTLSGIKESENFKTTDSCIWITSANDGIHMKGSKHYSNLAGEVDTGEAFDIRTKNIPNTIHKWYLFSRLRRLLPEGFQVLFEHEGQANEHIHVEWDPR